MSEGFDQGTGGDCFGDPNPLFDAGAETQLPYDAPTSYQLLDPMGTPVYTGDVVPDTITIGGPAPFDFEVVAPVAPAMAPDEVIVGGPDAGWFVADPAGNPIDPATVAPTEFVIGGPSPGFTITQPDGTPVNPGDILPSTVVVGPFDATGPNANPVLVLTDAAVQSQQRLAAMEWDARHPGEPYPTDAAGNPLSAQQVIMALTAEPGTTDEQIDRYNEHLERFNAVTSSIIEGMGAADE